MNDRHRAHAALAFAILGLTFIPFLGSVVALALSFRRTLEEEWEGMRLLAVRLGWLGIAVALIAIVIGLTAALTSSAATL